MFMKLALLALFMCAVFTVPGMGMRYSELSNTPLFSATRHAVPNSKILKEHDIITFELWAFLQGSSSHHLLGKPAAFIDHTSSNGLNVHFRNSGGSTHSTNFGFKLELSRWYHITAVIEKKPGWQQTGMTLFVNGQQIGTEWFNSVMSLDDNYQELYLGASSSTSSVWNGYITRVRLYNKVLSQNQIYRRMCHHPPEYNEPGLIAYWLPSVVDYVKYGGKDRTLNIGLQNSTISKAGYDDVCWDPAVTCAGDANNFILWWKFDNGLYDSSSEETVGQMIGPDNGISYEDGRGGKVLNLRSQYSYIVEKGFSFPTSDFSVCVWFKSVKQKATVLSYLRSPSTNAFSIGYNDATIVVGVNNNFYEAPSLQLHDDRWHQICVVRKGSRVTIYRDGMDVYRMMVTGAVVSGGSLAIGQRQQCDDGCIVPEEFFLGHVDDVMIFSRALRPMEVQTLARSEMFCCGLPSSDREYVCNGRGACSYPDRCSCDEQKWIGQNCEIPVCFEKSQTQACSGPSNGECSLPNKCECTAGEFTGQECEYPICGGIASNDPNVCNRRGRCDSPNSCICNDEGYDSATYCREPKCFGTVNGPGVCNSHGRCISPDECLCDDGWTGEKCQHKICHTFPENHPQVCSGNGTCTAPDHCECDDGYQGEKCQYPVCDKVSYDDNACGGNGNCVGPESCDCFPGWTGKYCETPICFNKNIVDDPESEVCSGNGACVDPNDCACVEGWSGDRCHHAICYTLPANDTRVCSGNGTCSQPNRCDPCFDGWAGFMCHIPKCFGTRADSENPPCSGHGTCHLPDTCDCVDGWIGEECHIPVCFNKNETDPTVCSSHGICASPDSCHCTSGWEGQECQVPVCFNTPATLNTVCSSRGNCTDFNHCICKDGFTGNNCEHVVCFSVPSNETNVCSGNGYCINPDECSCPGGWTGDMCQYPICFGKSAENSSAVCSGNGICSIPGKCDCSEGLWTGSECQYAICDGISANNGSVCTGHGTCDAPNNCTCLSGWTGDNCEHPICFTQSIDRGQVCSGRGTCDAPDQCTCDNGWALPDCQIPKCYNKTANETDVCSGRGSCDDPDYCVCRNGYVGDNCEFIICNGRSTNNSEVCSGNGDCESPNDCVCHDGWTDEDCQIPLCFGVRADNYTFVCSGNGTCEAPDTCECEMGRTDEGRCAFPICHNVSATDPGVCSTHGTCLSFDKCACDAGYTGEKCQYPICFLRLSNDGDVCSNHGECISPDKCACNEEYVGEKCQYPLCFGIPSNDTANVCHGNGNCEDPDYCQCTGEFTFPNCEFPVCFGIPSNDSLVCSSHGDCNAPGSCVCDHGYYGDQCQEFDCHGIHFTNGTDVCHGNGDCMAPDECQCNAEWFDDQCQYPICNGLPSIDPMVCSGNGTCYFNHTCICDFLYYGHDCQFKEPCFPDWYGPDCELYIRDFELTPNARSMWAKVNKNYFSHGANRIILNCHMLFNETTISKIGIHAVCDLDVVNSFLSVHFSSDATLEPGDKIFVTALQMRSMNATDVIDLTLLASRTPMASVKAVIAAPSTISSCSGAALDGSLSRSSDSRQLVMSWALTNTTAPEGDANVIQQHISERAHEHLITLDSEMLSPDHEYTFSLQVTDFLGQESRISYHTIRKTNTSVVTLMVNPAYVTTLKSIDVILHAEPTFPDCFHRHSTNDAELNFRWMQVSGPIVSAFEQQSSIKTDGPILHLPPNTFPYANNTEYVFECIVAHLSDSRLQTSARTTVTVSDSPLELVVTGGNRLVSPSSPEMLFISADCNDPDDDSPAQRMHFVWDCERSVSQSREEEEEYESHPCSEFTLPQNINVIALSSIVLQPDSMYTFTVVCSKDKHSIRGSTRVHTAGLSIKKPLHLSVKSSFKIGAKVPSNIRLDFHGSIDSVRHGTHLSIPSDETIQYKWSVVKGKNLALNPNTTLSASTDTEALSLKANVLVPGETYILRFWAKIASIGEGFSDIEFEVNLPPIPGICEVSPSSGIALETEFLISCNRWSDDDMPLTYRYFFVDPTGVNLPLSKKSLANSIKTMLPVGHFPDNGLVIAAEITNSLGASVTRTMTVNVTNSPWDETDDVNGIMESTPNLINFPAEECRDTSTVTNLVWFYSSLLNNNPESSNTSLHDFTEQIQIRQSLRTQLFQCYFRSFHESIFPIDHESIYLIGHTLLKLTHEPLELDMETVSAVIEFMDSQIRNHPEMFDISSSNSYLMSISNLLSAIVKYDDTILSVQVDSDNSTTSNSSDSLHVARMHDMTHRLLGHLILQTKPGEEHSIIETDNIQVVIKNDFANNLLRREISSSSHRKKATVVQFPNSFKRIIGDTFESVNAQVGVMMSVFQLNPFQIRHDTTDVNMTTPIVTLSLVDMSSGKTIDVADLQEQFIFTIPFNVDDVYDRLNFNLSTSGLRPNCTYWDEHQETWSTDGCEMKAINDSKIVCACNHLTSFSALMYYDFVHIEPPEQEVAIVREWNWYVLVTVAGITALYCALFVILTTMDFFLQCTLLGTNRAKLSSKVIESLLAAQKDKIVDPADSVDHIRKFRFLIKKAKEYHTWLSMFLSTHRNMLRGQRLTIVYTTVMMIFSANVLAMYLEVNPFTNHPPRELEWKWMIINGFVTSITCLPIVSILHLLFSKVDPFWELLNSRRQRVRIRRQIEARRKLVEQNYTYDDPDHNSGAMNVSIDWDDQDADVLPSATALTKTLAQHQPSASHPWPHTNNVLFDQSSEDQFHRRNSVTESTVTVSSTNSSSSAFDDPYLYAKKTSLNQTEEMSHYISQKQGLVVIESRPRQPSLIGILLDKGDYLLDKTFAKLERLEQRPLWQWFSILCVVLYAVTYLAAYLIFVIYAIPLVFKLHEWEKYVTVSLCTIGVVYCFFWFEFLFLRLKTRNYISGISTAWTLLPHLQAAFAVLTIAMLVTCSLVLFGISIVTEYIPALSWTTSVFDSYQYAIIASGIMMVALGMVVYLFSIYIRPSQSMIEKLFIVSQGDNGVNMAPTSGYSRARNAELEKMEELVVAARWKSTMDPDEIAADQTTSSKRSLRIVLAEIRDAILHRFFFALLSWDERFWYPWWFQIVVHIAALIFNTLLFAGTAVLSSYFNGEQEMLFILYSSAIAVGFDILVLNSLRFQLQFIVGGWIKRCVDVFIFRARHDFTSDDAQFSSAVVDPRSPSSHSHHRRRVFDVDMVKSSPPYQLSSSSRSSSRATNSWMLDENELPMSGPSTGRLRSLSRSSTQQQESWDNGMSEHPRGTLIVLDDAVKVK